MWGHLKETRDPLSVYSVFQRATVSSISDTSIDLVTRRASWYGSMKSVFACSRELSDQHKRSKVNPFWKYGLLLKSVPPSGIY